MNGLQQASAFDPDLAAAEQVQAAALAHYKRVHADENLSREGKIRALAPVYVKAKHQLAAIDVQSQQRREARRVELTRSLFGTPNDPAGVLSFRDAQARAEGIEDPVIAEYRLRRAIDGGDQMMARALAQHGAEMGWNTVVDTYTTLVPSAGETLQQLAEIQEQQNSPVHGLARAPYFSLPKPSELDGLQDFQIESIAAGTIDDSCAG